MTGIVRRQGVRNLVQDDALAGGLVVQLD